MDNIKQKVQAILKLLDGSKKEGARGCRAAESLRYNLQKHGGLIIKELTKREEKLREALRVAESTFRKYERLHRDKLTDAALDKADANRMLANIMEQALQQED